MRRSPSELVGALMVRWAVAAVFAYAGWSKLSAPQLFTATVVRMQLVPLAWAEWVASAVPLAEIIVAIWLGVGWRRRAAALAATMLAGAFVLALGQATARGLDFDCHCFGLTGWPLAPGWVLARALSLLGGGVWLWTRASRAASSRDGEITD